VPTQSQPRVAVIHDWLNGMRGGEKVLEAILELFPTAEIFTLFYEPEKISSLIRARQVHVSPLNQVGLFRRMYRHLLPLLPWAVRTLRVREFDLILSSSHCVAKGVRKSPGAVHVSYIHAPMRYMWSRFEDYFARERVASWVRWAALFFRPFLQRWDRRVSQVDRVDQLIANSEFIAGQIQEFYGRDAKVIFPFAELSRFSGAREKLSGDERYYLVVSAFAPNKRIDLAVAACARLGVRLKLVGSGQEEAQLRKMASSRIEFLGNVGNTEIATLYRQCEAFLFPGVEDFGITPLEAMASGAPVIAYQKGGACETVTPKTGVFFQDQTVEGLMKAIEEFEKNRHLYLEKDCRDRAQEFTRAKFQARFLALVRDCWINSGRDEKDLDLILNRNHL